MFDYILIAIILFLISYWILYPVSKDQCEIYRNDLAKYRKIVSEISLLSKNIQNIDITQTCIIILTYIDETISILDICEKIDIHTEMVPELLYHIQNRQLTENDLDIYNDIVKDLGDITLNNYYDNVPSHLNVLKNKIKDDITFQNIKIEVSHERTLYHLIQKASKKIEMLNRLRDEIDSYIF